MEIRGEEFVLSSITMFGGGLMGCGMLMTVCVWPEIPGVTADGEDRAVVCISMLTISLSIAIPASPTP
jgi:hypothetical protein